MSQRFKETAEGIKRSQEHEALTGKITALRGLPDGTVVPIPLDLIDRSQNMRDDHVDLESDDFKQLVETIREVGLLQNPIVTIVGDQIVCVAGHRRLAALEKLGQLKPSCILRHFEKIETKQVAQLVENIARKALHPLEIAEQLARLQGDGYAQARLQELLGRDRKTIGRYQKIASWPDKAKSIIRAHPERLKAGFLLQLASRTLQDSDLIEALQVQAGLVPKKKPPSTATAVRKLRERLDSYFADTKMPPRDCELIIKALADLGLILKGGGILDPIARGVSDNGILDPIAAANERPSHLDQRSKSSRKGASSEKSLTTPSATSQSSNAKSRQQKLKTKNAASRR